VSSVGIAFCLVGLLQGKIGKNQIKSSVNMLRQALLILLITYHVLAYTIIKNYATANNTNDRLTVKPDIAFNRPDGPSNFSVSINEKIKYQSIIGWGGALTEASAFVWSLLLPELQQEVLDAYFSPNGLGYSLCRVHMGAADFSLNKYNCDNVTGDYDLVHFNINRDRRYVLPLIKAAQGVRNDLAFFFSPWSPPDWMKKNNNMDGSVLPIGLVNR
jgi:glucosylceramidase